MSDLLLYLRLAAIALAIWYVVGIVRRQSHARRRPAQPASMVPGTDSEQALRARVQRLERAQLKAVIMCVAGILATLPLGLLDAPLWTMAVTMVVGGLGILAFLALEFAKGWLEARAILRSARQSRAPRSDQSGP